jgi:hypothetical protein
VSVGFDKPKECKGKKQQHNLRNNDAKPRTGNAKTKNNTKRSTTIVESKKHQQEDF